MSAGPLVRWLLATFDGHGLPASTPGPLRFARVVTLLATLWFASVALWEIDAPFAAGHYAASTAVALAGENMLRYGIAYPVTHVPIAAPTAAECYCHHPFGVFWTSAVFVGALGHENWVCRLPAVVQSALTPLLVYGIARALWTPVAAALSAVAFVLTPIALAFANFNALEVPVIFGTLLASFSYLRFQQTSRRRFAVLTLAALTYAIHADWAAFVFAAALASIVTLALVRLRRSPHAPQFRRTFTLLLGLMGLVAATGGLYLFALHRMGQLEKLIEQGRLRSLGADLPLADVLRARRYWTALMFTPLAVLIGKLGAVALAACAILKHRERELVPLALLGMAAFQYLVFKQGADVHVFWPHYFAPYFALSLGALTASLSTLLAAALDRFRGAATPLRVQRAWLGAAPLALGFVVPAFMAHDAVVTLVYGRKTGGRFNERGHFIQADRDKSAALAHWAASAAPNAPVALDPSMRQSLWVPWVLQRPVRTAGGSGWTPPERYSVLDARFVAPARLRALARAGQTTAVGPFWFTDRAAAPSGLGAWSIERREPTTLEQLLVSATHALRDIAEDPYHRWELRDHFSEARHAAPHSATRSSEQLRIAHNIAVASGNAARAQELRDELLQGVDRRMELTYRNGTRLLGARFERGASDVLTVYFESRGPVNGQRFAIHSRVEAADASSLVPPDPLQWEVGLPPGIPPAVWKRSYIYSSVTELLKRPGREVFSGAWLDGVEGLPRRRLANSAGVRLLVLP